MQAARKQAKGYAEAIPDQWPPFLIVVDVGFCFDLYADFSGSGEHYVPFPDPRSFRIPLQRLREEKIRSTLRAIWLDPHSLDPSKHAADVTRDIATRLAKLAKSLEGQHNPEVVAGFLMRCLFTMFAEDVELIRKDSFSELLLSLRFDLQIHDDLDAAVFNAYDWPHDLEDEEILQRLVDLNHERAEEESRGLIRWLRPEFQNPQTGPAADKQTEFEIEDYEDEKPTGKKTKKPKATVKIEKQPWPKTLPERMVAIQAALQRHDGPAEAASIATYYTRANKTEVALLLETLAAVGNVRRLDDGRFAAFK